MSLGDSIAVTVFGKQKLGAMLRENDLDSSLEIVIMFESLLTS